MAPPSKKKSFEFAVGDVVLASDCGKFYDAKILKSELHNGMMKHFIHFQGWNRRWDRWADESTIMKRDEKAQNTEKSSEKNENEVESEKPAIANSSSSTNNASRFD